MNMEHKPRILVVEDQPEVRELLKLVLVHAGCEVNAAETGNEGLLLAGDGGFDLITLDVDLPGASGFEICSRLKQSPELKSIPVVFVTGRFAEEDRQRARELGAADFFTKPLDLPTFVPRLLAHAKSS